MGALSKATQMMDTPSSSRKIENYKTKDLEKKLCSFCGDLLGEVGYVQYAKRKPELVFSRVKIYYCDATTPQKL